MWYNVQLENIPLRYSSQWNQWFPASFDLLGFKWRDVYVPPSLLTDVALAASDFLDPEITILFKSWQMIGLMKEVEHFDDDTVLWFHDLWHPALLSLIYLRHVAKKPFKIAGVLFAGAHDRYDRLAQVNKHDWALRFEQAILPQIDCIIVGSESHKKMVLEACYDVQPRNIIVLPYPVYHPENPPPITAKEKLIVFPHRIAQEKQPALAEQLLKDLCQRFPSWRYVFTKGAASTREQYHDILARSAISISTALQETFGIAMLESLFHNCVPMVPGRLSYLELFNYHCRYGNSSSFMKHMTSVMQLWEEQGPELVWSTFGLAALRDELIAKTNPPDAAARMLTSARDHLARL